MTSTTKDYVRYVPGNTHNICVWVGEERAGTIVNDRGLWRMQPLNGATLRYWYTKEVASAIQAKCKELNLNEGKQS